MGCPRGGHERNYTVREPLLVQSREQAEGLLTELIVESSLYERPVGLDTETTGCNPKKESPVGRAKIFCATLAWGPPRQPDQEGPSDYQTAYVPKEYVPVLTPWLENPRWHKVGTNLPGYDRHAFANQGVELRGIVGDTSDMSRLLDPSKNGGHSLKAWGARLGYRIREFVEVATVLVPGRVVKEGKPGSYQRVSWEEKQLDELWRDYPVKRKEVMQYACQDPAMSLDVYWFLRYRAEGVQW